MKHVALFLWVATLALAGCSPALAEQQLDTASSTDEIAKAVRALVLAKAERGKGVVLEFDAARPDFAFDEKRSVFVLFDASTGRLRCEHASGDKSLDQVLTLDVGIRAEDFRELVCTETPRGPLFVARVANGSDCKGVLYKADVPNSWIIYEVDAETLSPLGFPPSQDG